MAKVINKRSVRAITKTLGSYFMQGQVSYAAKVNGVWHMTPEYYNYPKAFGLTAEEAMKMRENAKQERYMVDFVFEEAGNMEMLYVLFNEKSLIEPLKEELARKIEHVVLADGLGYSIEVTPEITDEEEEAPAPVAEEKKADPIQQVSSKATYLHVGIPVTDKKPNMKYIEQYKVWITEPSDYDFQIEYLKYDEGTPFPGILHKNPHVAYMVEDMKPYFDQAQQVLFGPAPLTDEIDFGYILLDDTIIELQAKKK